MRPSTRQPLSTAQATSTGTADVKTLAGPPTASCCYVNVSTTDARVTLDGSTPSATNGLIFKTGLAPIRLDIGSTTAIKFVSTAAANSVVDVAWLN
jgi:hypothetical protein